MRNSIIHEYISAKEETKGANQNRKVKSQKKIYHNRIMKTNREMKSRTHLCSIETKNLITFYLQGNNE